ncbi:MAG: hypothetical protein LUF02_00510 [Erysipelotrichaceae bacterium]|nr:hypothetical protein [Erysipelotrichaceae bacterium]
MRLQLNLNQYYDGLDDYQVNQLFNLFMNMKPRVDALKVSIAHKTNHGEMYETYRNRAFSGFRQIDDYMKSLGKDVIFDMRRILDECDEHYDQIDVQPLLDKYTYLMEEI